MVLANEFIEGSWTHPCCKRGTADARTLNIFVALKKILHCANYGARKEEAIRSLITRSQNGRSGSRVFLRVTILR